MSQQWKDCTTTAEHPNADLQLVYVCRRCLLHCHYETLQRWANSVLRTEYEYEYYSSSKKWPNTNTNIIRLSKTDRIRIRILFGLPKMTEYEYEYYSAPQKRPNTNTNIIRLSKNDRIRIRILMDSLKTQIIFIFVLAQQCNIRGAFIHFSFWAHYCAQRQNIKEYKRTIYFQKVQTGCIFLWSPPKKFQVLWSGW